MLAIGQWLIFRHVPPVPDVATFLDGTNRWLHGATLYVDYREINPPLIFYEFVALTGGFGTSRTFVAGVVIATTLSALWIARHHGARLGLGVVVSISFAGMTEFAQREHLLLIFVLPYLLARGTTVERSLMGLWAFFGVALKPHFLPIVALPALLEAWRNPRSLFDAQKVALGTACVAYVIAVQLFYPIYFNEIVPWARRIYSYHAQLPPIILMQVAIAFIAVLLADEARRPLAAAVVGAVASYILQGRFWPYHFIAAAGLAMVLCFWQRRLALWAVFLFIQAYRGPYVRPPHATIPEGVDRVAVLSMHPSASYPTIVGCGVTNTMRIIGLGWLPAGWTIVNDRRQPQAERQKAQALLLRERALLRRDIIERDTQVIIADARARKPYFDYPIDYMKFIGPFPGFRLVRKDGDFEIWAKGPVSEKACRERY